MEKTVRLSPEPKELHLEKPENVLFKADHSEGKLILTIILTILLTVILTITRRWRIPGQTGMHGYPSSMYREC